MSDHQEPDSADVQVSSANSVKEYPKALRVQRFAAALIDTLILAIALTPISFSMDFLHYAETGEPISYAMIVNFHICAYVFFLILNGWLLYRYGQTIGKRFMKIAIATENFQVPNFNRLIALRYLPFAVANVVPVLALLPIIDVLMIFREDKRCMHDMLARTQVIDVSQAG